MRKISRNFFAYICAAVFTCQVILFINLRKSAGSLLPTAIGLIIKSFDLIPAYKNIVSNVPGRGAVRIHSGAPANTMIYPVRTTYFVCEQYNSGVSQREVNATFSFFKNKDREWTYSKDS